MKEEVYTVHWYGPHTEAEKIEDGKILYLATGGLKRKPKEKLQYCGITNSRFCNRYQHHHTLDEITLKRQFWIGWLNYPNRIRPRRAQLEAVESLIVYYWGDLLNKRKTYSAPRHSITVISRWFRKDWKPSKKPMLFRQLPDVISWDAEQKRLATADFQRRYRAPSEATRFIVSKDLQNSLLVFPK
jgi:hypothetical protein